MTTEKIYPAGRYYVGDLCYLKLLDWDEFCEKTNASFNGGDLTVSGRDIWYNRTAYGDGEYDSNFDLTFFVDSGTIGLCQLNDSEIAPRGGHAVLISAPFAPRFNDGTFLIGGLEISTNEHEG